MACVNLTVNDRRVHVCNFLPIVLGTRLDLRSRGRPTDPNLAAKLDPMLSNRFGHVYAYDNFWVFSSFISTDSRQCHKYREHTKAVSCTIRMYVYDRTGKGHMFFMRQNDNSLHMRDKFRREIGIIDELGRYRPTSESIDVEAQQVIDAFARDALVPPFDRLTVQDFFRSCYEYMRYGVNACSNGEERVLGCKDRDIDHLDNKRISVAPGLYGILMRSFARSLVDGMNSIGDDESLTVQVIKSCAARYSVMSHRANLLPFISRKTHIRQDWCESMKRQMKSEIRSHRRLRGNAPPVNGNGGTIVNAIAENVTDDKVVTYSVCVSDVTQDNTKISQQFYCSKLHTDVEYDHEIVKRMRVINLNAMTCLRMPLQFERFLSYYNVGNIGNAGRVMTRVHGMRESYVARTD